MAATVRFISFTYDAELEKAYVVEDGTVVHEKSDDVGYYDDGSGVIRYDGVYLGYILPETTIGDIKTQFSNELELIKVYSFEGILMEDDTKRIGTGYYVTLEDSKGNIIDKITCIIYGDLNSDGYVDANDLNIFKNAIVNSSTSLLDWDIYHIASLIRRLDTGAYSDVNALNQFKTLFASSDMDYKDVIGLNISSNENV